MKLKLLLAVLLCAVTAPILSAQTQPFAFFSNALAPTGTLANSPVRMVTNATIRVCLEPASGTPCTPLATIYSDPGLSVPLANPFQADFYGNYVFYVPAGTYHVQQSGPQVAVTDIPYIVFGAGGGGGGNITFEHNGVTVGVEPKYNMVDTGTAIWTVTDDPTNTRVNAQIAASGGGGGLPAGVLYDIQINDPLHSFGSDTGVGQINPTTHTITELIASLGQQVNVSDTTHNGQICQGHTTGSAIDSAYCTQPSATFSPTPTGGYGTFPPDNAPSALNQSIIISNATPTNIVTQYGTLPFYPTQWGTPTGAASLENLPFIYTDIPCNSPATCTDFAPIQVPYQANNFYAGPRVSTGGVGYLANTVTAQDNSGTATHATFTFPYPTRTGDPLVLIINSNGGSPTTPTDSCGNTWAATSNGHAWYVGSAIACAAPDTVTQSLGGTGDYIIGGGEVSGGGVLDTQASGGSCGSVSGSTYPITFTSVTTTHIDTLVTLITQGSTAQTGLGVYFGTNGLFLENQASYDGGGGLGDSWSVAMAWQPALTPGSNNTTINYTYTGSSNICSAADSITLAFKPSTVNNPANPTARDIYMDDLEQHILSVPSDGHGLVFDAAYGIYYNLAFGSGLTYTASTHTLSASGSGVASIQPENNGTPYGSPLTGAVVMNFANCTVSATFTITCASGLTTTGSPASGNLAKFSGTTSLTNADLTGAVTTSGTVATTLAASYRTRSCEVVWAGTGAAGALQSGDDAAADQSCLNAIGVTETITAVQCRSDAGSNTTTVNPTFGSSGSGTTICSGALTCGSSGAYSSTCTVSNASLTSGSNINPVQGGTLTGTSIHLVVTFTLP